MGIVREAIIQGVIVLGGNCSGRNVRGAIVQRGFVLFLRAPY